LPILILRDPPGGSSYVEFTEQSSLTTIFTFNQESDSNWNFAGEAKIGINTEEDIGGLFVMAEAQETKLYLGPDAAIGATLATTNQDTLEFDLQAYEILRTSSAIGLAGELGDLLVGCALIIEIGYLCHRWHRQSAR